MSKRMGLQDGLLIRNVATGRVAIVLDAYERCPYTSTLLARISYVDDNNVVTIVNPGWMPSGWEEAER